MDIFGQCVFPGLDLLGQGGLRHPVGHQGPVADVGEGEMVLDVVDDIRQGAQGFEGHARQGIEDAGVPEIRGAGLGLRLRGRRHRTAETEGHHGRRSLAVGDHFAGVRDHGLLQVDVQGVEPPAVQDAADDALLLEVAEVVPAAGKLGEGLLRNVVLGGAEAAGDDDDVVVGQFFF